jgi:hypothetical protein
MHISEWKEVYSFITHRLYTRVMLRTGFQLPAEVALNKTETNSVAFSPQTKCADRATVAGRRILVRTFADRGTPRGQRGRSSRPVILFL